MGSEFIVFDRQYHQAAPHLKRVEEEARKPLGGMFFGEVKLPGFRPTPEHLQQRFVALWGMSGSEEPLERERWASLKAKELEMILDHSNLALASRRYLLLIQEDSLRRGKSPGSQLPLAYFDVQEKPMAALFEKGKSVEGIERVLLGHCVVELGMDENRIGQGEYHIKALASSLVERYGEV